MKELHVPLRLVCIAVALVTAALAFGVCLNSVLRTPDGWQKIAPENAQLPAAGDFLLCYELGRSGRSADDEQKELSALYSQALDHGSRVLSNTEGEGGLYELNRRVNEDISVDPLLYDAFRKVEASGSRLPYFAPLMDQYRSLFASVEDTEAAELDPARSGSAARFAEVLSAFARDPEAVEVRLLPEGKLRLAVSPEYLRFAQEHDVECFVDLGMALNAFLCDVVADALEEQGYVNGYISSFDGYTRALCPLEFGLNVFDRVDGRANQLGTVTYNGPAAIVSCRSFPILEIDWVNYYTYSDGTVLAPYLNDRGELHCASFGLSTLSRDSGAAPLALRTLAAFAGEDGTFSALGDLSWVSAGEDGITLNGPDFSIA